jgi:antitoxin component HigA of HigAB toxin-antitoxin module
MQCDGRDLSRSPPDHEERVMPHLLDPKRIDTQATYLAALHELDALMDEDADAGANNRIDELFALVEAYELRQSKPVMRDA